jgi:23S rRNA (cytidine1920-2'-O)/16S rRNA (cytidine1409-2'-O)-methyltransferase
MPDNKERLDILLVNKGLSVSREKAKTNIMAGLVFVNNQKIDKPGTVVNIDSEILVKGNSIPYVSRGGLKLEKAIKEFNLLLNEKICMDVGASTGGFTDCMLQNGASKVYAVDVGYGQFAWSLRTDKRVVCMERTNIRNVTPEHIDDQLDFASIDVSFISLTKVFPAVKALLKENGEIVALIKPQFEAGKGKVGKKGVVREKEIHSEVINNVISFAKEIGFFIKGLTYSPVKGPEGNIEYLVYISKSETTFGVDEYFVENVVNNSHGNLD